MQYFCNYQQILKKTQKIVDIFLKLRYVTHINESKTMITVTKTQIEEYVSKFHKEDIYETLFNVKSGQIHTIGYKSTKKKGNTTLICEKFIQVRLGCNYGSLNKVILLKQTDELGNSMVKNSYKQISPALVWNESSKTVQLQGDPLRKVRENDNVYRIITDGVEQIVSKEDYNRVKDSLFTGKPYKPQQLYIRIKLENVLSIN